MISRSDFLQAVQRVGYFIYVLALLTVIYITVQTLLQASYGTNLAKDASATLDRYRLLVDYNANFTPIGNADSDRARNKIETAKVGGDANTTAAATDPKSASEQTNYAIETLKDLRVNVLVKNCAIVSWTRSLSIFVRLVGAVVDDMKLHSELCESPEIFQLVAGTLPSCTVDDRQPPCVNVLAKNITRFKAIAPSGNVAPFADNVAARTNALLQQLQTVLLPFLFGVIGGFLAVFFNPSPESVQFVSPGGEATRYAIRPFVGGVAGLLVCFLFAGGPRVDQSYSINTLGLLVGYGLELLPLALNAGVIAIRDMLEKRKTQPPDQVTTAQPEEQKDSVPPAA